MSLRLDWCSREAAKYACEHWHYSKCLPSGNLVTVGAWEHDKYIGCVIFGHGAIYEIGTPYGLTQFQCVELVRIALTRHDFTVSRIMSLALKFLRKRCPKLRLVVSYADPAQGHHGGIYQATNWIYTGQIAIRDYIKVNGQILHPRSIYAKYGTSSIQKLKAKGLRIGSVKVPGKHKYLMPLDNEISKRVKLLSKPYPKRAGSKANVALADQAKEGGATPTPALHNTTVLGAG